MFAISAAYAGIGGALYVFAIGFAAPESFTLALSFGFLAAIVIGGLATIGGAIFGALFIQFVPEWAGDVDEALVGVIYGGVLMLFMFVLPGGAASLGPPYLQRSVGTQPRGGKDRPARVFGVSEPRVAGGRQGQP